jgi:hypothetical protein
MIRKAEINAARLDWTALTSPLPALVSQFNTVAISLTGPGDVWSLTSGDNTWTFTHSTGDLGLNFLEQGTHVVCGIIRLWESWE